mgnify:CR=1 FL=1
MRKIGLVILLSALLGVSIPVIAQDSAIKQTTTHNVFKGMLLSIWGKLKSLNPTQKQSASVSQVYTAGIRGAESTDSLLKPYWKDDLTQDEAFQAELKQFSLAQQKLDQGQLEEANQAFDQFLDEFSSSSLRPNALFAKGISLAGSGKAEMSVASLKQFIDENPGHPLAGDAQLVINQLTL